MFGCFGRVIGDAGTDAKQDSMTVQEILISYLAQVSFHQFLWRVSFSSVLGGLYVLPIPPKWLYFPSFTEFIIFDLLRYSPIHIS